MKKVINNTQNNLTRNEEIKSADNSVIHFPQKKELVFQNTAPPVPKNDVKTEENQEVKKGPVETLLQRLDRLENYHKKIHYYLKEIESFQ